MRRPRMWDKEAKLLFAKLVLLGVTFEFRYKSSGCEYSRRRWYITLPDICPDKSGYIMGGYNTKTEAVEYAAKRMEII